MTFKMAIDSDEYYPFRTLYTSSKDNDLYVCVTEDFKRRYDRIMSEFAALQEELGALEEKGLK